MAFEHLYGLEEARAVGMRDGPISAVEQGRYNFLISFRERSEFG